MTITDNPQHEAALAEFLRLAQDSQTAHRARLLELCDALNACENAQGQEPPLPHGEAERPTGGAPNQSTGRLQCR